MSDHGHPSSGALPFGPVRQLAFVVDNAEAAAAHWAQVHGAGPFWVYEVDIADTNYRGETSRMWATMALGHLGDQQIELIEPRDSTPSVYREFVDGGRSGLHHICYWHDIDTAANRLMAQGHEMVQRGTTSTGAGFAYLTGGPDLAYIELVDPRAGDGAMGRFFDAVAASSHGWDGSDPVRAR